ncbi:MAG TPA: amidase family protein [Vineibacter sp.]|nr:amidase family protein [Vineibacter sp.]
MADRELWRLTAVEAVDLLKRRQVSPLELIDAAQARTEALDGAVNAMVTRTFDRARQKAKTLQLPDPATPGWLGGLPLAVKDLNDVEGVRTTFGSLAFKDNVAERTCLSVQHLEAMGGLVVGKSNTPEFGAGAQTFNEVFGITRNPWDTRLTCAGSSGGAAVVLASGQVWLATGSDLGGSLRTPASFCGVVGFRPSPGRVPFGPSVLPLNTFPVNGPMGRCVADVALMLDATAKPHPLDPLSYDAPTVPYAEAVANPVAPKKVAWGGGFNGLCPLDPEVEAICRAAALRFAELGAAVEDKAPDASGARDAFQVFRGHFMAASHGALLERHRDLLKPEVIWNIGYGLALSSAELRRASLEQGLLYNRFVRFMGDFDILAVPTAPVPPFPVEQRYVESINGQIMPSYIDWVLVTSIVTMTGLPSVSLPAGFTKSGLPVGLMLVGRPRGEAALLSAARLFEDVVGLNKKVPIDPVVRH